MPRISTRTMQVIVALIQLINIDVQLDYVLFFLQVTIISILVINCCFIISPVELDRTVLFTIRTRKKITNFCVGQDGQDTLRKWRSHHTDVVCDYSAAQFLFFIGNDVDLLHCARNISTVALTALTGTIWD